MSGRLKEWKVFVCFLVVVVLILPCYYSQGDLGRRKQGDGSPENYFLRVSQRSWLLFCKLFSLSGVSSHLIWKDRF